MNDYSVYLLEALEQVLGWGLSDDAAIANAANQQAKLMAGCFNHDESRGEVLVADTIADH